MKREELTQEKLKELLNYDPDTGVFTWRERELYSFSDISKGKTWNSKYAHKIAGSKNDRGLVITLNRKQYYARRLAWLYVYGAWPEKELDPLDGDQFNDSIENLRNATRKDTCNKMKQKKGAKYMLGVRKEPGLIQNPFGSQIRVDGKLIFLGCFPTEQEAHDAYVEAKRQVSPEFCML